MNDVDGKLTLKELWRQADFVPNPEQEQAILHVEGPLYIPAGPGSGKTRVLLWRTLNLIVFHGINPEEVFLSTFTEKAAFQLQEGLRALLGAVTTLTNVPFDISSMYVGTVHSLCRRLLTDRRFSAERKRSRAPLLMDEIDQYIYLYKRARWEELTSHLGWGDEANENINEYFSRRKSPSKHTAVMNCISFFNRLSEENIDPRGAQELVGDGDLRKLLNFYEEYLASLSEPPPAGTMDFSLLQQRALRVLKRHESSNKIFRHVIIDEYQDTNPVQEQIYFELARGYNNLCVVGDDDQGLYRIQRCHGREFRTIPCSLPERTRRFSA